MYVENVTLTLLCLFFTTNVVVDVCDGAITTSLFCGLYVSSHRDGRSLVLSYTRGDQGRANHVEPWTSPRGFDTQSETISETKSYSVRNPC